MNTKFYIQIPNRVIRANELDDVTFFVYCKLIQYYWYKFGKQNPLELDHHALKYHTGIKSNKKLKECLQKLYQHKLIKTEIEELPRNEMLKIELNTFFDKEKLAEINEVRKKQGKEEKVYYFAQLPCELLDVRILNIVKYTGVRLMYYYQSYVNKSTNSVFPYAFTSLKTIEKETGLSENTIIKYNSILKKNNLLYIEKHQKGSIDRYGKQNEEVFSVKIFNNHYHVQDFEIVPLLNKLKEKIN